MRPVYFVRTMQLAAKVTNHPSLFFLFLFAFHWLSFPAEFSSASRTASEQDVLVRALSDYFSPQLAPNQTRVFRLLVGDHFPEAPSAGLEDNSAAEDANTASHNTADWRFALDASDAEDTLQSSTGPFSFSFLSRPNSARDAALGLPLDDLVAMATAKLKLVPTGGFKVRLVF